MLHRYGGALAALVLISACTEERFEPDVDAAVPVDAGEPPEPVPPTMTAEALEAWVYKLADPALNGRDEGTPGGNRAREMIVEELGRCGVEPAGIEGYEQPITTGEGTNVLGLIAGTDESLRERVVLLSAHYDHLGLGYNGADDNAAGVATVLGVACALAESPLPRSVMIALWDAEEPPTFLTDAMGSAYFVSNPTKPLGQIDVAIALDLVGSAIWGTYAGHFVFGSELSLEVRAAVDAAPVPEGLLVLTGGLHLVEETPLGFQPWSDYHPFREAGVPVLFFSNGQTKHYHEMSDDADSLNYPKMALQARYLLSVSRNLASADSDPVFNADGADYGRDAETLTGVLEAAVAPGGLVESLGLSSASGASLQDDLVRVRAVDSRGAADADAPVLRSAAQRLICLAGSSYREDLCNLL